MTFEITARQKPGRKSTVATHPQREMIEAACAAGMGLSHVAKRFWSPSSDIAAGGRPHAV